VSIANGNEAANRTHPAQPRLTDRHLADLRASGLSNEQISACGFRSLRSAADVEQILRWRGYDGKLGECLCIPFADHDGKPSGYARLKPDRARRSNEDGRPIKYESPKGSSNRAYFPPGTRAALADPLAPLIITEGEKKSAKADQERIACIGLVGVYGWQKKRQRDADGKPQGNRELIDDLARVAWHGRPVYLCFDSDAEGNANVRRAESHLADALASRGATVRVVRLAPGQPDAEGKPGKVGLDDYLVAQGPDAFRELLATATEPAPPLRPDPPRQVRELPDDPHRLARLFIGESCQHADGLTLRFYREEWHRWDGSAYRTVPEKELRAALTRSVKAEFDRLNLLAQSLPRKEGEQPPAARKVKGALVADVAHALASLTILRSRTEAPDWIGAESGPFPASESLACRNGLVYLPSLVAGEDYFRPPTPAFFSPNALDFDFNLNAPAPATWLAFLRELWDDDSQSIDTLQEWIGYLLTPDTRQQKMLLLVGPKRSGKGTVARVIRGLIGPENVAGPTLSSLGTNFGLWPLLGKTAAIISDARLSGRTDTATVTERLLSISGEDALTIDRKNLPPVTVKLAVRFSILTNELPRLGDSSGALTGRMILLRMTRSWYGKEDTALTDRLLSERPGILVWAIEGWRRLRERGHFVQPEDGRDLLGELDDLASPVGAFVRERCRVGPGYRVAVADLFAEWKRFCDERGRKEPGTEQVFGRDLLAAVPTLRRVRPRDEKDRYRAYEGIGLR
jgi:putative DNA primase/helicase